MEFGVDQWEMGKFIAGENMDNKKRIIYEKDYEHYSFPVPLSVLLRNKGRNYICSELEKRQPCFSDDYCFDTKFTIRKRSIYSDVFVMNKMRLLEYKSGNSLSDLGFKLENSKFLFRFANKKFLLFLCISVLMIITAVLYVCNKIGFKKIENQQYPEIEAVSIPDTRSFSGILAEELFDLIEKNEGKIQQLEWKCDGFTEAIDVEVEGIFPEYFDSISEKKISEIKYSNNKPSYSFGCSEKIRMKKSPQKITDEYASVFFRDLRNCLFSNNALLIEENEKNLTISFYLNRYKDVISNINEVFAVNDIGILEVSCSLKDKDNLLFKVRFSDSLKNCDGVNFQLFSTLKNSFYSNGTENITLEKKAVPKSTVQKKEKIETQKNKVGEIMHSDGKKNVFFKDEKGRLIKEERNE